MRFNTLLHLYLSWSRHFFLFLVFNFNVNSVSCNISCYFSTFFMGSFLGNMLRFPFSFCSCYDFICSIIHINMRSSVFIFSLTIILFRNATETFNAGMMSHSCLVLSLYGVFAHFIKSIKMF